MPHYLAHDLLPADPFATLDAPGVGELARLTTRDAKAASPATEVSVCGEHGGDPASIAWFDRYGLDDVSCSPSRILVARLAAAQAALGAQDPDRDR